MLSLLHRIRKLTEDFDGDKVRLSLTNLIDSDAGDVGLSLQGHWADGPVVGVDIVDPVTAPSPDVAVSSWTTYGDENTISQEYFSLGAAYHRGCILASHPAAPGSNPGSKDNFFSLLLCL